MKKTKINLELNRYYLEILPHDFKHDFQSLNLEIRCSVIEDKKRREVFTTLEIPHWDVEKIIEMVKSVKAIGEDSK